jgi:hypothetical protein
LGRKQGGGERVSEWGGSREEVRMFLIGEEAVYSGEKGKVCYVLSMFRHSAECLTVFNCKDVLLALGNGTEPLY